MKSKNFIKMDKIDFNKVLMLMFYLDEVNFNVYNINNLNYYINININSLLSNDLYFEIDSLENNILSTNKKNINFFNLLYFIKERSKNIVFYKCLYSELQDYFKNYSFEQKDVQLTLTSDQSYFENNLNSILFLKEDLNIDCKKYIINKTWFLYYRI